MAEAWTPIGKVVATNPARRELRIRACPGRAKEFVGLEWLRIAIEENNVVRCRVESLREHADVYIAALAPGVTRERVAEMKNAEVVLLPGEERPSGGGGVFEVWELVGMAVETADGRRLGKAAGAMKTPGGGSMLLPVVDEVIESIDWDKRLLRVKNIEAYAVHDEEEEEDERPKLA